MVVIGKVEEMVVVGVSRTGRYRFRIEKAVWETGRFRVRRVVMTPKQTTSHDWPAMELVSLQSIVVMISG